MKRYRDFCTGNACYRLHYGNHFRATRASIREFDAIVLETGFSVYEDWDIDYLLYHRQYSSIFKENACLKNPRPIFYVDIPERKRIRDLDLIGYALTLPADMLVTLTAVLFSYYLPSNELADASLIMLLSYILETGARDKTGKFLGYLSLSHLLDLTSYRSVISAEKIEKFVAPEMERRIGRKPRILIDFGAGHADMEIYLTHKKLRSVVLNLHRCFPFKRLTKDISYESKVGELRHNRSIAPSEFAEERIASREPESLEGWERILYEIDT